MRDSHQLRLGDDPRKVTLQRAWNGALRALAERVSKATFEGYVRQTRPVSWEGHVVTLAVASPFAQAWLSGRYAPLIRQALESALGSDLEVRFIVEARMEETPPA